MNSRVFNARDGDGMNVWCCAAFVLGAGDEPPALPLPAPSAKLEAKPMTTPILRTETSCPDCGGKIRPRPPVVRQVLPSMAPPDGSRPLTTMVQSSGPVAVELPHTVSQQPTVMEAPPSMSLSSVIPTAPGAAPAVAQKAPWWKRVFARRTQQPTISRTAEAAAVDHHAMSATMPPTAGRALRRETWRAETLAPVLVDAPKVVEVQPTTVAVQPLSPQPETPTRTAARSVHTTRKPPSAPTTMIRDASVWGYTGKTSTSDAKSQTVEKSDWPAKVELPEAPADANRPVAAPLPSWTDEVVRKSLDAGAERDRPTQPPVKGEATVVGRTSTAVETLAGQVGRTHADGGYWTLKTGDGKEYMLKGDDSILRLRIGDQIEVSGSVKHVDVMGMPTVAVEKMTLSAKR
jgi:hypothetical protein